MAQGLRRWSLDTRYWMLVIGYSLLVSGLWLLIFKFGVRSLRLFEVRGKAFDRCRLEVGGNKEK